jgi:CBS domain-containing protein
MSVTPLVSVASDQPLERAAQLMAEYGSAHLAVTDPRTERPIGVISTLDVARAIAAGRGVRETYPSA